MFEGDVADTCPTKSHLVSMGDKRHILFISIGHGARASMSGNFYFDNICCNINIYVLNVNKSI